MMHSWTPLLAMGLWVGCDEATNTADTLPLTPCHVAGLDAESLCGTVTVFENRAAATGRTIDLRVMVIPAISPYPEPDPLFFLAGGPGQAASDVAASILPALTKIQRQRDLVFVDQRGTGQSNGLQCPEDHDASLREMLTADPQAEALACRDALQAQSDLTMYTTDLAVADLEEVRQALGYAAVNLYGVSYGTRVAMAFAQAHRQSVRAMILDGVVPPQMPVGLHFAQDGQAALDALLDDCAADEACAQAFPDLRTGLQALLEQMAETPEMEVVITHPRTGRPETIPMTRETLALGLQGMLYAPALSSLTPLALQQAYDGDFTPFVAQTLGMSEGMGGSIAAGMRMSVLCAEDFPRYTEERTDLTADTLLGGTAVESMVDGCADWPRADMASDWGAPLVSDVPTLLLSGALDPVTPPRWGALAAETLSQSVHAVAPGAGHNVGPYGCVPRVMADFVASGSVHELDTDCVENVKRPPFFIDFAGPAQ